MNAYIKSLKDKGYTSLRDAHYDEINSFPALGKNNSSEPLDPDTVDMEDQIANDNEEGESEGANESKTHVLEKTITENNEPPKVDPPDSP